LIRGLEFDAHYRRVSLAESMLGVEAALVTLTLAVCVKLESAGSMLGGMPLGFFEKKRSDTEPSRTLAYDELVYRDDRRAQPELGPLGHRGESEDLSATGILDDKHPEISSAEQGLEGLFESRPLEILVSKLAYQFIDCISIGGPGESDGDVSLAHVETELYKPTASPRLAAPQTAERLATSTG
jgi:hypothetical protein